MDQSAGALVKDTRSWVSSKWQNRMVQLSVYAGVLFWVVAHPEVFSFMKKFLPQGFSNVNQLVIHSVFFAVLMYVGTTMFMDPVLSQLGLR